MDSLAEFLQRKRREIALLSDCLEEPASAERHIVTAQQALECKLRLAAALRAKDDLKRWRVTETARQPPQRVHTAAHEFHYNYQRADLEVQGPSIYPALATLEGLELATPLYNSSGMSAIATLLTALRQWRSKVNIYAVPDVYDETRDLMRSLGAGIQLVPVALATLPTLSLPDTRVLWLDSSTQDSVLRNLSAAQSRDLVVFDTSCHARTSGVIHRTARWALQRNVALVLVRSHTKLDNLGIEYGRLGSIVLVQPRHHDHADLLRALHTMQRLLGAGPGVGSFPPFVAHPDYEDCSASRTAAIIRNTRYMARVLATKFDRSALGLYHHGMYLTIAMPCRSQEEVVALADDLAASLADRELPVRHAGSFGFDFVAIDRHADPLRDAEVLRIAGADLPRAQAEAIAEGIAEKLFRKRPVATIAQGEPDGQ